MNLWYVNLWILNCLMTIWLIVIVGIDESQTIWLSCCSTRNGHFRIKSRGFHCTYCFSTTRRSHCELLDGPSCSGILRSRLWIFLKIGDQSNAKRSQSYDYTKNKGKPFNKIVFTSFLCWNIHSSEWLWIWSGKIFIGMFHRIVTKPLKTRTDK